MQGQTHFMGDTYTPHTHQRGENKFRFYSECAGSQYKIEDTEERDNVERIPSNEWDSMEPTIKGPINQAVYSLKKQNCPLCPLQSHPFKLLKTIIYICCIFKISPCFKFLEKLIKFFPLHCTETALANATQQSKNHFLVFLLTRHHSSMRPWHDPHPVLSL